MSDYYEMEIGDLNNQIEELNKEVEIKCNIISSDRRKIRKLQKDLDEAKQAAIVWKTRYIGATITIKELKDEINKLKESNNDSGNDKATD